MVQWIVVKGDVTMNSEFVSVARFAELAGISTQAVYKQLEGKLEAYVQMIDGKKRLPLRALYEVYEVDHASVKARIENGAADINAMMDLLRRQLEVLQGQIQEKDRQISELHQIIAKQNGMNLNGRQTVFVQLEEAGGAADPEEEPGSNGEPVLDLPGTGAHQVRPADIPERPEEEEKPPIVAELPKRAKAASKPPTVVHRYPQRVRKPLKKPEKQWFEFWK